MQARPEQGSTGSTGDGGAPVTPPKAPSNEDSEEAPTNEDIVALVWKRALDANKQDCAELTDLPDDVLLRICDFSAEGSAVPLGMLACTSTKFLRLAESVGQAVRDAARAMFGALSVGTGVRNGPLSLQAGTSWQSGNYVWLPLKRHKENSVEKQNGWRAEAASENYVVKDYDDRTEGYPLFVRDARNFAAIGTITTNLHGTSNQLAIFGPVGREAVAKVIIQEGPIVVHCYAIPSSNSVRLMLTDAEPQIAEYHEVYDENLVHLLGSATFLIVGVGRFILVYTPCDGGGVAHVGTTDTSHASVRALCWARDLGEGAFASCAESGAVQVWRADTSAGCTGTLALTLPLGERAQEELATIAVVERYIAVSYEHTKALAVFDHGGTRLHVLEEAEDPDDFKDSEGGDFIFNRALVAQGEILATSSICGAALCVWCMRRGQLLYRLDDWITARSINALDELPEGCDVCDIQLIRGGTAVMVSVFGGLQAVWAFPCSDMERVRLERASASESDLILQRIEQLDY